MTKEMDFTQAVTEFLKVFRKAAGENPEADRHVYLEIVEERDLVNGTWDDEVWKMFKLIGNMQNYWKIFYTPFYEMNGTQISATHHNKQKAYKNVNEKDFLVGCDSMKSPNDR